MFCIQVMTSQGPGPAEVKKSFMVGEPRTWEPLEVWFLKKLTFLQEACKPSKATKQGMRSGGLCRLLMLFDS